MTIKNLPRHPPARAAPRTEEAPITPLWPALSPQGRSGDNESQALLSSAAERLRGGSDEMEEPPTRRAGGFVRALTRVF